MDPDEFRRLLCRAVHLPDDASEYAILAEVEPAYHFWLLHRPAPGDDLAIAHCAPGSNQPPAGETK